MDGYGEERILSIPTEQGDVPIDLADLPADAEGISDIVGLLAADAQPAHYWAALAYEYLQLKNEPAALEFLGRGSHILRMTHHRAQGAALLDAMLAAVYCNRARTSPKQILPDAKYQPLQGRDVYPKQAHYGQATQYTNSSASADPRAPHSQLSRAIDMALKGATADAEKIFNDISTRQPNNCLALLGKACCLLRRRVFPQALSIYQQVLALTLPYEARNDFSRPDPRIGMGLCLAGMGRVADARRAWTRSSELYPNNAASKLLLGLSAFNAAKQSSALPLGLFGDGQTLSESSAREAATANGLEQVQAAWRLNNKSAMAAVALARHFTDRAYAAAVEGNNAKADTQFAQALKLGEHAVQYADARSDMLAATSGLARTAHLALQAASRGLISVDEIEMRTLANRHWARVVEDLARAPLPGTTSAGHLSPLQSLASLSLAQLQLGQGEVVAAMHTLDTLRLASGPALNSASLEPALLEASLRAASHPGANRDEIAADRQKAQGLFERAFALAEAAESILKARGRSGNSSLSTPAKLSLVDEGAGESTVRNVADLTSDTLAGVALAQILQTGSTAGDLPRAARRYAQALHSLATRRERGEPIDASLEIRLRANLGAVLGVRALESAVGAGYNKQNDHNAELDSSQATAHPLIEKALEHLRVALDAMRASDSNASDDLEFEKTTVMYNAARLQEASSHASGLEDARQAYETILQIHPEYIDARIRLAIMIASLPAPANIQGKATQLANSYFKEALSADPSNLDTRASYVCFLAGELGSSPYPAQWSIIKDTLAELFLGPNDSKAAKTFGGSSAARLVADAATQDPFIMSSMGWAYFNLGREAKDKKERDRCMIRACEFFSQALANDRKCAVAAQGLGIVLCDDGLVQTAAKQTSDTVEAERAARKQAIDEALSTFLKLREIRDDGTIHICIGHALSRRDERERASKAFEVASKQYYNDHNPQALTYLAIADYHAGLQLKSYPHLQKSLERLQAAQDIFQARRAELTGILPSDASNGSEGADAAAGYSKNPRVLSLDSEIAINSYNEAVIKQKGLQLLLEVPKEERSLDHLLSASEGISQGLAIFQKLLPVAQKGLLTFLSSEIIEQRIQYGESLLARQVPEHIEEQRGFEAEASARSQALKAARLQKEQERIEAERLAKEEEEKRLESIRELRRKAAEEAREFQYKLPSPEPEKKKKRGAASGAGEGGGAKKRRKRGASSEVETDEEERRLNDIVRSDEEEGILSDSDDDDGGAAYTGADGDGEGEDAATIEARRSKKREEKKKAKMEELRAARASKKGSSKPKSEKVKKKKKTIKRRKAVASDSEASDEEGGDGDDDSDDGAVSSDEEEVIRKKSSKSRRGGGGGGGGGGKSHKKASAPAADRDLIDSDEEM